VNILASVNRGTTITPTTTDQPAADYRNKAKKKVFVEKGKKNVGRY
jgi:hypothetical protein